MASQTVSPHEAEIARRKLRAMGHEPPKAQPKPDPKPEQRQAPDWDGLHVYRQWTSTTSNWWYTAYWPHTSNPAADERPSGSAAGSGWNPKSHPEEPHWFAQWYGDMLRRQGADDRDIENGLREMRARQGWAQK